MSSINTVVFDIGNVLIPWNPRWLYRKLLPNDEAVERFLDEVDSAAVYVNASTRFTDGFEFGLGAEIGISTNKLHCRGPMALQELTCLKYIIRGSGQIRE